MTSGMICKPGEIIGLPFPFSDLASLKKRPVLVLTQADYRGDFMGLAITSVLTEENAVSIVFQKREKNLRFFDFTYSPPIPV